MKTYGQREGNITHQGLLRGWGAKGRIALGKILNVDCGVMDAANHHGMYIPM